MIYCIEDDNGIRDLIVYTLNASGFEAMGFANSKDFWNAAKDKIPDLILLDIIENNITFEIQKRFEGLVDKSYLTYDFYIPSKNLLIEFNGEQHYCWKKHLQPSYHDFLIQKHHDWLKRKYAQKHNIKIVRYIN